MEHIISVVQEKTAKTKPGGLYVLLCILGWGADIAALVFSIINFAKESFPVAITLLVIALLGFIGMTIFSCGFHIVEPNQAIVLTLFGKYYGTVKEAGFYYVNPFCSMASPAKMNASQRAAGAGSPEAVITIGMGLSNKKISLRTRTLNNERQKVNDILGNPIIIGANVIWKVADPTAAVFNVENFEHYLSTQCDSVIRNIARLYPYDTMEEIGRAHV